MAPLYALAAAAALCVLIGVWGYGLMTSGERVAVSAIPSAPKRKRERTSILTVIAEAVGRPLTRPAMDLLGSRKAGIRRRIDAAGRPGGLTVETYVRRSAGYILIFGSLGLVMIYQGRVVLGVILLAAGLQNDFVLFAKARERQEEIQRTLPDFLDVLSVTVSAGLSFRHALVRVAESMPGALAEEFTVALRQMELGTPRREAFEDLRRRNNSEAVAQFVTAILQAEELGAPLSKALLDIAENMRREAAQWAKRRAQRLTPRITAVTTTLTLPALLLLVVGSMLIGSGVDFGAIFGR